MTNCFYPHNLATFLRQLFNDSEEFFKGAFLENSNILEAIENASKSHKSNKLVSMELLTSRYYLKIIKTS